MKDKVPAEVIDRASEWFIALREPEVPAAERAAFADWLRQSPAHVRAYVEIACLWDDAARVTTNVSIEELAGLEAAANVVALETSPMRAEATHANGRPPMYRSRLAASLVVGVSIAIAATAGWWHLSRSPVHTADVGEQRIVTLEDGSVVRLNSRSSVRVNLTDQVRDVELLAGQALFEVAKDPRRPFRVESGDARIEAVGTAFDVYRKAEGTRVTVVEGQVRVEHAKGSAPADPVHAGEQVLVRRSGAIEREAAANVAAATSWTQQELVFTGEPLREVVAEFNRYTRRTIILSDPALAELRVNAVFHTTNPESFLTYVRRFDGIQVEESGSEVRIVRRDGL